MDDESIQRVLGEYGVTAYYHTIRGKIYVYMGAGAGRQSHPYLASQARLKTLSEDELRRLIAAKSVGERRNKCGKASCRRRGQRHNRAIFATPLGNIVVYLCNQCFAEYQEVCRAATAKTAAQR